MSLWSLLSVDKSDEFLSAFAFTVLSRRIAGIRIARYVFASLVCGIDILLSRLCSSLARSHSLTIRETLRVNISRLEIIYLRISVAVSAVPTLIFVCQYEIPVFSPSLPFSPCANSRVTRPTAHTCPTPSKDRQTLPPVGSSRSGGRPGIHWGGRGDGDVSSSPRRHFNGHSGFPFRSIWIKQ